MKVKDAIVDRILSQRGRRPDSGPNREQAVIYLHWVDSDCHIYFDTSGETISKHGYRKIPYKAPLRESLAAALIKATQWKTDTPLVNPMAGSGTLAIEAAMMASQRAPGLYRKNFGFMHLKGYQKEEWLALRNEAADKVTPDAAAPIIVNDNSLEAIRAAKMNATWAGVNQMISFRHGDFNKMEMPSAPGVVILNPGYGTRIGEIKELGDTYRMIGDFFKEHCPGFWGYVFTGNPELSKQIGLRTSRKMAFYNGSIECRLLEYELYLGSKKNSTAHHHKS
jgi:putative N6-adenine-specific DNA methylase